MNHAKDWIPYYIQTYMYLLCIKPIRLNFLFLFTSYSHKLFKNNILLLKSLKESVRLLKMHANAKILFFIIHCFTM